MRWQLGTALIAMCLWAAPARAQLEGQPCVGGDSDAVSPILRLVGGADGGGVERECPDYRPGHSGLTFQRYQSLVDEHDNVVFASHARETVATVTKYDPKFERSTLEYVDGDGKKHETWLNGQRRVGENVALWYDSERPFISRPVVPLPDRNVVQSARHVAHALDAELRPAVRDTLRAPDAVYYGEFTWPAEDGESQVGRTKDGLEGLRIIWEKTVKVGANEHLITVITTARLNPTTRRMEIVTGDDALRVRVELTHGLRFGRAGVVGMSYGLTAKDGTITGLKPGVYFTKDGKARDDVAPQAHVEQCSGCHFGARRKNFANREAAPARQAGYRSVMDYLTEKHADDAKLRTDIQRQLASPRSLIPPGILDVLGGCQAGRATTMRSPG